MLIENYIVLCVMSGFYIISVLFDLKVDIILLSMYYCLWVVYVCWYLFLCNKFIKYNKWLNDVVNIFYFVLVFILKNYEMLRNIDLNR